MINEKNTIVLPIELTEEEDKIFNNNQTTGHLFDLLRYFRTAINKEHGQQATILDIGCRDDLTRDFFTQKGFNWVGIDIEPKTSSILRGDMHDLPVGDESVEFIFCSHALEHTERPIDVLREFKRVTKLSGYVFIATPAYSDYQLYHCDKEHINVPLMPQIRRWAQHLGYEIVHQIYVRNELFEDRLASLVTILRVVNK